MISRRLTTSPATTTWPTVVEQVVGKSRAGQQDETQDGSEPSMSIPTLAYNPDALYMYGQRPCFKESTLEHSSHHTTCSTVRAVKSSFGQSVRRSVSHARTFYFATFTFYFHRHPNGPKCAISIALHCLNQN